MGRWLALAREEEEKSKSAPRHTDKTDETGCEGVLSVLSVREMAASENFSPSAAPAPGPVSSVLSVGQSGESRISVPEVHRCACGAVGIIATGWFLRSPEKARWYCGECYRTEGRA
jgi:hypothetical protein